MLKCSETCLCHALSHTASGGQHGTQGAEQSFAKDNFPFSFCISFYKCTLLWQGLSFNHNHANLSVNCDRFIFLLPRVDFAFAVPLQPYHVNVLCITNRPRALLLSIVC